MLENAAYVNRLEMADWMSSARERFDVPRTPGDQGPLAEAWLRPLEAQISGQVLVHTRACLCGIASDGVCAIVVLLIVATAFLLSLRSSSGSSMSRFLEPTVRGSGCGGIQYATGPHPRGWMRESTMRTRNPMHD